MLSESEIELKRQTAQFFDEAFRQESPLEGNFFHDYFKRLSINALAALLKEKGVSLAGKSVHIAGCGAGIDLLLLSRQFKSRYFVTDISSESIALTQRRFPQVPGQVEDMEHLSFEDNTFDWSFVSAALHHLPRPVGGLFELLRVSREGVIFIEPYDSWLVRLFVKLGLAQEYEPAGNYVYRWRRSEVRKLCNSLQYDWGSRVFFQLHRVARTRVEFECLRMMSWSSNLVIPWLGSQIVCCVLKRQAAPPNS